MTIQTSDNKFGVAQWIVDPTSGLGTHTTIQAAINDASSGDTIFVRPGTYTEDLTLAAGIDIVSFGNQGETAQVTIIGNATATFAGTASYAGLRFQTNNDFLLSVTGTSATVLRFSNCFFNITNNDGIQFTSTSASAEILIALSYGDFGTTGIKLFDSTSAGTLRIEQSIFTNSGGTSTASTMTAGEGSFFDTFIGAPITSSGTARFEISGCSIADTTINTTMVTIGGTGGGFLNLSGITSGTAVGMTVDSSCDAYNSTFQTSNANAIDGTGTLDYSGLTFSASNNITTTTTNGHSLLTGNISFDDGVNELDFYEVGSFTPSVNFGGGTTGITYASRSGEYTRIGNVVTFRLSFNLSSKGSSTGTAGITGFPFTANGTNDTNAVGGWGTIDLPASYFVVGLRILASTSTADFVASGDNNGFINLNDTNFTNTSLVRAMGMYYV
jgi:hypothetical protein